MIIPKGRFLEPAREVARIMGKIGKIQGEIMRLNPSINPKTIVIKSDCMMIAHESIPVIISNSIHPFNNDAARLPTSSSSNQ